MSRSLGPLVLVGIFSCGDHAPTAAPPASPTPSATTARPHATSLTTGYANLGPAYVGEWSSGRCGIRKYERVVRLLPGGSLETEDRFDACAPGEACEGDGRAIRRGVYRVTETGDDPMCVAPSGHCIWLDADAAQDVTRGTGTIPQYPALLFFGPVPWESDGEGTICRYRRLLGER